MKRAFLTLLTIDIVLVILIYFFKGDVWVVNSQVAFISSSLVMFASMLSYRAMVERGLNAGVAIDNERDTLDKLEDPYDLYDEERQPLNDEKSLKEVVLEERQKLKKSRRSVWQTTKDAKASFSLYRLSAYIILILGFFYLNANQLLELWPYLTFLSLPPIIIVFVLTRSGEEKIV